MAETPKPINIGTGMVDQFACQCGWKSEPYFDGAEWALDDFNNHVNEVHMTPAPLPPSSDEVEKLLANLDETYLLYTHRITDEEERRYVNRDGKEAAALIRSLQSELGSHENCH